MKFLFFEIWVFLLLTFLLGMFVQWFFCCRGKKSDAEVSQVTTDIETQNSNSVTALATPLASAEISDAAAKTKAVDEQWRPMGFSSAPSDSDELKRIKGIGSVIEGTLNELGIYQFKQIAAWDDNNAAWVENFLSFPGRINREDWISQAKTLADGGSTEFAARVDKGDVNYEN